MEPESDVRQRIGDYLIFGNLGSGMTGKVKLARHSITGAQFAIKDIKKSHFDKNRELRVKVYREISLMRFLDHPHLLKLTDLCESAHHLYLVLEYAPHGELFDFLSAMRVLPVELGMQFFRQIIYGLDFLHTHGICHRDLKPENILLDEFDDLKIADFGFARWMRSNIAETSCGSPHYAAPEVVRGIPYDGRAADIWSCGVILFALLAGRLPFTDPSIRNLLVKVKSGQYAMPDFPAPVRL
jgi:BR serine/threonine kinase